jgi:hypothetical protein
MVTRSKKDGQCYAGEQQQNQRHSLKSPPGFSTDQYRNLSEHNFSVAEIDCVCKNLQEACISLDCFCGRYLVDRLLVLEWVDTHSKSNERNSLPASNYMYMDAIGFIIIQNEVAKSSVDLGETEAEAIQRVADEVGRQLEQAQIRLQRSDSQHGNGLKNNNGLICEH